MCCVDVVLDLLCLAHVRMVHWTVLSATVCVCGYAIQPMVNAQRERPVCGAHYAMVYAVASKVEPAENGVAWAVGCRASYTRKFAINCESC